MRGGVHGGPSTRFFERGDPRGETATSEEEFSGRDESLIDIEAPGRLADAAYSQKLVDVHDV